MLLLMNAFLTRWSRKKIARGRIPRATRTGRRAWPELLAG